MKVIQLAKESKTLCHAVILELPPELRHTVQNHRLGQQNSLTVLKVLHYKEKIRTARHIVSKCDMVVPDNIAAKQLAAAVPQHNVHIHQPSGLFCICASRRSIR